MSAPVAPAGITELNVYARLPITIVRGEGSWVFDAAGRRYLDFYGGHAVALTGHCHPHVVRSIQSQAERLLFYSSAVHSDVRERAGQLLLARAPHPGSRLFHCVSGTEANEVAFKIARKATGRPNILSFTRSFHGRTLGSLSACGIESYRKTAGPVLVREHQLIPFGDVAALAAAVDDRTAGIIVETIQSLAGIFEAGDDYFPALAAIARARGAALIFDEVQTGFGRTGSFFFAEQVGVQPDLITLAKGIASGVPAAAVIVAPHLAPTVAPGDHGSTFGGGPLAMAAMTATLEVIERQNLVARAKSMGDRLRQGLCDRPGVRAVRGRGLLLGIELEQPAKPVTQQLLAHGVLVGTSAAPSVIRLLPPLTISASDVDEFLAAFEAVMAEAA